MKVFVLLLLLFFVFTVDCSSQSLQLALQDYYETLFFKKPFFRASFWRQILFHRLLFLLPPSTTISSHFKKKRDTANDYLEFWMTVKGYCSYTLLKCLCLCLSSGSRLSFQQRYYNVCFLSLPAHLTLTSLLKWSWISHSLPTWIVKYVLGLFSWPTSWWSPTTSAAPSVFSPSTEFSASSK